MGIGYDDWVRMLRASAGQVRANHERLSKLDSFGGDGDHGTTMVRAMAAMEKAIDGCAERKAGALLQAVGWAIMGVDGGATGPLLGTLLMSIGDSAGDRETLDAAGVAGAFEAGLAGVRAQTKAQAGDKTMLDALIPAVEAMRSAVTGGAGIEQALAQAASAAEQGAERTAAMQARFGRAKNLGAASVGNPDPGATSVSLLFRGLSEGARTHG